LNAQKSKQTRSKNKELTIIEICNQLGDLCPPGSFRLNAAECGVFQQGRKENIAGRNTWFFPGDSVEIMRAHIEQKRAGRSASDGR
jgi:hypothetical protein